VKFKATDITITKKNGFVISDNFFAILLILPALFVLGMVVALPILKGIYVSFCDYKISNLDAPVWNNWENYIAIFKSGDIFVYFKNTIIYVALAVGIQFVLGLAIALLLNAKIKGRGIFRGLFLIPWTIPSVVVALLFRWMLNQHSPFA
jgi:multiple sugar transport system permease protein